MPIVANITIPNITDPEPVYPVLARKHSTGSIAIFRGEESGTFITGMCAGQQYCASVLDNTLWEILPKGSEVTLKQM